MLQFAKIDVFGDISNCKSLEKLPIAIWVLIFTFPSGLIPKANRHISFVAGYIWVYPSVFQNGLVIFNER